MSSRVLLLALLITTSCGSEAPPVDDCADGRITGPIFAETDADVAALAGCHVVEGSLYLWGAEIGSLAPLAELTAVDGALSILQTSLRDAAGLEQLERVGLCLELRDNPALESVRGLEELTHIGGCLSVGTSDASGRPRGNPALESLDALRGVEHVGYFATVANNARLPHLHGLSGLRELGGDLTIEDNATLQSVSGLMGLERFRGEAVTVAQNPALPACEAEQLLAQLDAEVAVTHGNDDMADCR